MIPALIIIGVIILLAGLYLFLIKPRRNHPVPSMLTNTDYAHRGLYDNENGDGENTLPAFSAASDAGVGIELDVRLSGDGQVVVFHDNTLERLAGRPDRVDSLPADVLAGVRIGPKRSGIPLLSEVLCSIDPETPLCIELKGDNRNTELCCKVAEIMDNYNGFYSVESFNPFLVGWFRKNRPDVVRGQLVMNMFRLKGASFGTSLFCTPMLLNCVSRPDYISTDIGYRNSLPVTICEKLFHARIFSWTANTVEEYAHVRRMGDTVIFQHIPPSSVRRRR